MGFKGFKIGNQYKAVNTKFNKTSNNKNEQIGLNEIKEHLKFMVTVGLLEEKDGHYKEPKICKEFTEEQREFILSVSEKSYKFAKSEETNHINRQPIDRKILKGETSIRSKDCCHIPADSKFAKSENSEAKNGN